MHTSNNWIENNLSPELMEWEHRSRRRAPLTSVLIGIPGFATGLGLFFVTGSYKTLIINCVVVLVVSSLFYESLTSALKLIPKKIKYSQMGIHYIRHDNKEKFIPWSSITFIGPQPPMPFTGKRFEDYCMIWKKGFASTSISREIGIELEAAWKQYKGVKNQK